MIFRKQTVYLLLSSFVIISQLLICQNNNNTCKTRLPETINSYQPSILPVITVDGRFIFFDRKLHPDNTGSINDIDDIWFSEKDDKNNWLTPVHPGDNINTKNSDVLFSITPYGTVLLYGTNGGNKAGFSIASRKGTSWINLLPLKISNYYNYSDNFFGYLSADGKVLLLALDRDEGKGKLDLYVCFRNGSDNEFTAPRNLGDVINTKDVEGSPFLAFDNKTLYFTSQGHPGFGGKDIFMSRRLDNSWTRWSKPVNLGKQINSAKDENSVYLTALGDSIIMTSWDDVNKREGIYTSCLPDSLQPSPYMIVRGRLNSISAKSSIDPNEYYQLVVNYDKKSIPDTFRIYDKNYYFAVDSGEFISVFVSKSGFQDFGFSVNSSKLTYSKFVDYNISLKEEPSQEVFLTKVLFDYDSFVLNTNGEKSAMKVNDFVMFPKEARLLVVGHADKSGTDDYNMKLSQSRAETVANLLIKYGFDLKNIKIVAKGKSEPISANDAENRRVEVYLIEH